MDYDINFTIVLNKCDLVSNNKIENTISNLKEIKTDARILKSVKKLL